MVTAITQLLFIARGGEEDVVGVSMQMVGEVEENMDEVVIQSWPVMVAAAFELLHLITRSP